MWPTQQIASVVQSSRLLITFSKAVLTWKVFVRKCGAPVPPFITNYGEIQKTYKKQCSLSLHLNNRYETAMNKMERRRRRTTTTSGHNFRHFGPNQPTNKWLSCRRERTQTFYVENIDETHPHVHPSCLKMVIKVYLTFTQNLSIIPALAPLIYELGTRHQKQPKRDEEVPIGHPMHN